MNKSKVYKGFFVISLVCFSTILLLGFIIVNQRKKNKSREWTKGESPYGREIEPGYFVPVLSKTIFFSDSIQLNSDISVVFEDVKITKEGCIRIVVDSQADGYSLYAVVNGKRKCIVPGIRAAKYEASIQLVEGNNDIELYAIDSEDIPTDSVFLHVVSDTVAPKLEMDEDYRLYHTKEKTVSISGTVDDCDKLMIDGIEYAVKNGRFNCDLDITTGSETIGHTFMVIAQDKAGNASGYMGCAEYIAPVEDRALGLLMVILCMILCLGVVYLYDVIKNNRLDDGEISRSQKKRRNSKRVSWRYDVQGIVCNVIELLIPIAIILILFKGIFCLSVVQSGSMEPTLMTGSTVVYNRLDKTLNRGDIVAFISDEYYGEIFSKRIIGIPGDRIEFKDGNVVINGDILDEKGYLSADVETLPMYKGMIYNVPKDCYFMLGDNREYSADSRIWNDPYINNSKIIGTYVGPIMEAKYDKR